MGRHFDAPDPHSDCPGKSVCLRHKWCNLSKQEACKALQHNIFTNCEVCKRRGYVCSEIWRCWKAPSVRTPKAEVALCQETQETVVTETPCDTEKENMDIDIAKEAEQNPELAGNIMKVIGAIGKAALDKDPELKARVSAVGEQIEKLYADVNDKILVVGVTEALKNFIMAVAQSAMVRVVGAEAIEVPQAETPSASQPYVTPDCSNTAQ